MWTYLCSSVYMGYHMASFIYMWMLVSLMTMDTDSPGMSREVPW